MVDHNSEYDDIPAMIGSLRSMDAESMAYLKHYDAIVRRTMPLAVHIANKFGGRGQSHQDLVQVASLGLVKAVTRFDLETGTDFLSFAVPTIMGEIRRHFRDYGWAVKVPRRLKDLNGQLNRARTELGQELQRAPTPSEIAAYLGIDSQIVVEATVASANYSTLSTDRTTGADDSGLTFEETFGGNDSRLDTILDIEAIRPLIQRLPSRERQVLKLRFFDELTQTQIANHLGCSQMHVSRILTRTLTALREQATADVPRNSPQRLPAA